MSSSSVFLSRSPLQPLLLLLPSPLSSLLSPLLFLLFPVSSLLYSFCFLPSPLSLSPFCFLHDQGYCRRRWRAEFSRRGTIPRHVLCCTRESYSCPWRSILCLSPPSSFVLVAAPYCMIDWLIVRLDLRSTSTQHDFLQLRFMISHYITHHVTWHHITSYHCITPHHITSHDITSHHTTSHHMTSHHITSHHITWYNIT